MNHQNRIITSERTAVEATGGGNIYVSSFVDLLWVFLCIMSAMPSCASVYICLVVTCWERADLLAVVCGVQL